MSFSSFAFFISLASIVFLAGILWIRKSHRSSHQKREMRHLLLKRMESLRLPRMLQALGVSLSNFLYRMPVDEIDLCVSNCEKCETTEQCDKKLKIPELNPGDIEFCKSQSLLSKHSREKRIKN